MTIEQLIGQFKAYTEYPNQDTFVISNQTCQDIVKYLTELQAIKDEPPTDDWEHYADKLYELAYKHGWNDAKENKVGHWYKANSEDICYTCSFCGATNASGTKYNYCPHCGAKMTESEDKK